MSEQNNVAESSTTIFEIILNPNAALPTRLYGLAVQPVNFGIQIVNLEEDLLIINSSQFAEVKVKRLKAIEQREHSDPAVAALAEKVHQLYTQAVRAKHEQAARDERESLDGEVLALVKEIEELHDEAELCSAHQSSLEEERLSYIKSIVELEEELKAKRAQLDGGEDDA